MKAITQSLMPSELSDDEVQLCLDIIKAGAAVTLARAKREFSKAMLVSIRREDNHIVGVGVVKMQRPDYAASIASPSKANFNFDDKMHEIGYVSVKSECEGRGHCQEIVASLLSNFPTRPVFATTFTDAMKHILPKFRFIRRGKDWRGDRGDMVSLWIKETP